MILAFVIGYKLVKRDGILKISEIDIDTGRREKDLEKLKAEIAQEEYDLSQRGFAYRVYNFWC